MIGKDDLIRFQTEEENGVSIIENMKKIDEFFRNSI